MCVCVAESWKTKLVSRAPPPFFCSSPEINAAVNRIADRDEENGKVSVLVSCLAVLRCHIAAVTLVSYCTMPGGLHSAAVEGALCVLFRFWHDLI